MFQIPSMFLERYLRFSLTIGLGEQPVVLGEGCEGFHESPQI